MSAKPAESCLTVGDAAEGLRGQNEPLLVPGLGGGIQFECHSEAVGAVVGSLPDRRARLETALPRLAWSGYKKLPLVYVSP